MEKSIAGKPDTREEIFLWAPKGLQVSPDGRYAAYYVLYNSASLSADGVPVQLFNLGKPTEKPVEVGAGLAYPEWLSWSPDGSQLAFIEGTGREATQGKRLRVVDRSGLVLYETAAANTVSFPVWTTEKPYSLFFASGTGVPYHYEEHKVLVPGQRIHKRDASGTVRQVTRGTQLTADTFPVPSPDGNQLLFLRLNEAGKGSLFLLKDGVETELIRHVTGDIGYYGSYLPKWVQVSWEKQTGLRSDLSIDTRSSL